MRSELVGPNDRCFQAGWKLRGGDSLACGPRAWILPDGEPEFLEIARSLDPEFTEARKGGIEASGDAEGIEGRFLHAIPPQPFLLAQLRGLALVAGDPPFHNISPTGYLQDKENRNLDQNLGQSFRGGQTGGQQALHNRDQVNRWNRIAPKAVNNRG